MKTIYYQDELNDEFIKNQTFCMKPLNNCGELKLKIDFKPFLTGRK